MSCEAGQWLSSFFHDNFACHRARTRWPPRDFTRDGQKLAEKALRPGCPARSLDRTTACSDPDLTRKANLFSGRVSTLDEIPQAPVLDMAAAGEARDSADEGARSRSS